MPGAPGGRSAPHSAASRPRPHSKKVTSQAQEIFTSLARSRQERQIASLVHTLHGEHPWHLGLPGGPGSMADHCWDSATVTPSHQESTYAPRIQQGGVKVRGRLMVWPRLQSRETPRTALSLWGAQAAPRSIHQCFSAQPCPGVTCEPRNQGPGPRPGFQPTQSV